MEAQVRALIYTRVSQDRAGGRSPAEQEAEARALCDREGWQVVEVVTDSVGASRHSKGTRAGWAEVKKLMRAGGVDVLVTWEASRAQRDLEAYAELRQLCVAAGVRWSYSGRTYDLSASDDRFKTGLDALLAEREADESSSRIQRAIRANAAAGRPHGRRLFGYQRVYDGTSGRLVGQEPHPEEAAVVCRIFADYLAGSGIRTIAAALNDDHVRTGSGARWNDAQVRRVLVNPAYVALRVHRGEVVGDGDWPALVDRALFERVQARLVAKRTSKTRQTRTANLLSGVGRCGVCLGKVQRGHDRNQRKTYLCKTKFCTARDLAKLDAYVTAELLEWMARPDVVDALNGAGPPPAVVAAMAEVEDLRRRLDDAVDEFTAGRISAGLMGRVEAELTPQIKAAEARARRGAIPLSIDLPEDGDLDVWWDAKTPEEQREVVGAVIDRVWLLPAVRGSRTFDPETVRIDWR